MTNGKELVCIKGIRDEKVPEEWSERCVVEYQRLCSCALNPMEERGKENHRESRKLYPPKQFPSLFICSVIITLDSHKSPNYYN